MASLTITLASDALKEYYNRQMLQNLVYPKSALIALLPKDENFVGKNMPLPITYEGPQGASADDTVAFADANKVASKIEQFTLTRKKYYGEADIDGETIYATKSDKGAFLKATTHEIDGILRTVRNRFCTQLYGSGTGSIGQVGSYTGGASTFTLAQRADVVNFAVGMEVAFDTVNGGGTIDAGTFTVTAVDRSAGTVTSDAAIDGQIATFAANGFLFPQGDYDATVTGLGGWIPSTAPTSGDSFFSVDRSVDTDRLAGVRYDGSSDPIDEALFNGSAEIAFNGGEPDICFVNTLDFARLSNVLKDSVRYDRIESDAAGIGFRTIMVAGEAGDIAVVSDRYCPRNTAFMLQMDTWKFYSMGMCPRMLEEDGLTLLRKTGSDKYATRVGLYGNLGCSAPAWSGRITLPSA